MIYTKQILNEIDNGYYSSYIKLSIDLENNDDKLDLFSEVFNISEKREKEGMFGFKTNPFYGDPYFILITNKRDYPINNLSFENELNSFIELIKKLDTLNIKYILEDENNIELKNIENVLNIIKLNNQIKEEQEIDLDNELN